MTTESVPFPCEGRDLIWKLLLGSGVTLHLSATCPPLDSGTVAGDFEEPVSPQYRRRPVDVREWSVKDGVAHSVLSISVPAGAWPRAWFLTAGTPPRLILASPITDYPPEAGQPWTYEVSATLLLGNEADE